MEAMSQAIVQNLPAIICLVVGFVLVVVEMYIPGFGLPGILGCILLIAGVAMKAQNAVEALVMTIVIIALLCIALSISIHSASKGRLANSKLVLHEVSMPALNENDLGFFVGQVGVTRTVLRPAGIGEFDGVKLNVVSDGEFLPSGASIRVDRVEGNRIVVSRVEGSAGEGPRGDVHTKEANE